MIERNKGRIAEWWDRKVEDFIFRRYVRAFKDREVSVTTLNSKIVDGLGWSLRIELRLRGDHEIVERFNQANEDPS